VLERHADATGVVALDDRWFPVVIGTWLGDIDHRKIDAYYAWYDRQLARAEAEGTKVVVMVDSVEATPVPTEIRRRFIHETNVRAEVRQRCVASVLVVVRGAFLMGIVASVVTMVRGGVRLSTFADMPSALERALVKLDALGVPRPAGLDPKTYVRPVRDP
jgi:hypothetical protein